MNSSLANKSTEVALLDQKLTELQSSLSEAHQTTALVREGNQSTLEQKAQLESALQELHKRISSLEAELESGSKHCQEFEFKIKNLKEIRSTLHSQLSKTQTELSEVRLELESVKMSRDKALTEAEEARCLWEGEVRSKSKLSMKLSKLEQCHVDASQLVENVRSV